MKEMKHIARNLLLSALVVGVTPMAKAEQLTPQQALSRLGTTVVSRNGSGVGDTPVLTVMPTGREGFNGLYVFAGTQGYVVVSADDSGAPLLGYSDVGTFNPDSLAPSMKAWLESYADQIYRGAEAGVVYRGVKSRVTRQKVSPMLTTTWDQTSPYNNLCPLDGGVRTYTGCVATAMAQVMNYHKWPVKGTGSNSYSWNGQTLSMDFSTVTFDWNNMPANCNAAGVTDAQKNGVATLMKACGYAVNMDYGTVDSGASSLMMVKALCENFGYSKGGGWARRCFYTTDEWENLVYNELTTSGPVLYDGESGSGGHQFVCDGYDGEGYFHINWGWSGMSDGYFMLSALDPESQGAGGSLSGYNFNQGIAVNVHPVSSADKVTPMMCCYGNFGVESNVSKLGNTIKLQCESTSGVSGFFNFGASEISGYLGIKIVSADGTKQVYAKGPKVNNVASGSGFSSYMLALPTTLAAGTYYVTPAFQISGSATWSDMRGLLAGVSKLRMTVNGTTVTIADVAPALKISDASFVTPLYIDTNFKLTFKAANMGEGDYYGNLAVAVYNGTTKVAVSTDNVAVDLKPGDESTFTYVGLFDSDSGVEPGKTYTMKLVESNTGDEVAQLGSMTFKAKTTATISVSGLTITGGTTVTDPKSIEFTGKVSCQSGFFADRLVVALFGTQSNYSIAMTTTDVIFLNAGETADFKASMDFSQAVTGAKYGAAVFYDGKQKTDLVVFTVKPSSALNEVQGASTTMTVYPNPAEDYVTVSAAGEIAEVNVYGLSGTLVKQANGVAGSEISVDVSALAPGVYVVRVRTSDGKVAVNRLIKR